MATSFEFWLVGEDPDHLSAVGEAALDEVSRVERLLSRYDRASEISRINQEAHDHPVRIDRELFSVVSDCLGWLDKTLGYFDITADCTPNSGKWVTLDPDRQTVRLLHPSIRLDLGGYGKGYALEVAARVLEEFGIGSAVLHGGTSSILIRGRQADGSRWRIGLRDPFSTVENSELIQVDLDDSGISTSAVFHPGADRSDLMDPIRGQPLEEPAACSVIGRSATEAEVLSTALLAMGRDRAREFVTRWPEILVAWIAGVDEVVAIEWLGQGGRP